MARVVELSCPARRAARQLSGLGLPAYVYYFNHTPLESINQFETQDYGAFHGSEVPVSVTARPRA